MQFTVLGVEYPIGQQQVRISTQHDWGFKSFVTTQDALAARCTAPNTIWSDAEVVAEVQAQLDAESAGNTAVAAS